MDQVIVYDKSLQERMQEYLDVLSGNDTLPVSHIKNIWAFYLELAVDPNGWQAVWKIPRATCKEFKIPFPTLVLVYIDDLNLKDLSAYVRILAVQDDISLHAKHVVPLTQLYPTKDQAESVVLNMQSTSNALDMLRFFYNNLIVPWDYEDDDTTDWVSKHLESRLRLYYDMKNGVIPRTVAEHVRALFMEARRLQARRHELELEIDDDSEGENIEDQRVQALMELHVRMIQIKGEIEILENPLMRYVVLKEQKDKLPKRDAPKTPIYWLLAKSSTADDYIQFLQQVKEIFPKETLNFSKNLLNTLDSVQYKDVIVLNKAKYALKTVGKLEKGGTLRGVYTKEDTEITSEGDDVMFDFSGDVILEDITINAKNSQFAILVRLGKVTLKNCKLIGKHQGVIVLEGSQLILDNCEISGFSTAIVGNSGSKIEMNGTEIHHVNFGVKMYDNCTLTANKSTFSHCLEYGFCVETDQVNSEKHQVGSFDILKMVPDIRVDDLDGNHNGKGDVSINRIAKIQPLKDLFSSFNDDLMDTGSEEEEHLNDTVIENK